MLSMKCCTTYIRLLRCSAVCLRNRRGILLLASCAFSAVVPAHVPLSELLYPHEFTYCTTDSREVREPKD